MPKLGAVVVITMFSSTVFAQPGSEPSLQPGANPDAAATQPAPAAPPAGPPAGATAATFTSTSSEPWQVLIDRQPACETPCSIYVPPMKFVTLRSRDRVLLEVGTLPPSPVVVRGKHLSDGAYAGGIVGTTFSGMGLVTGITLTAVGCATDHSGLCTAGLITGGVSAVGLYLSIRLMQSAVPKAEILPARPYVAGNSVGLAGTF